MGQLRLEFDVEDVSIEELRPALDAALEEHFPSGLLEARWEGEVLRLEGPGAEGQVALVDGRLVARATLRPPATLLRPMIESRLSAILRSVVGRDRRGRMAKS